MIEEFPALLPSKNGSKGSLSLPFSNSTFEVLVLADEWAGSAPTHLMRLYAYYENIAMEPEITVAFRCNGTPRCSLVVR